MGHLYNTLYKNMSHSKMCCSSYPMVLSVNHFSTFNETLNILIRFEWSNLISVSQEDFFVFLFFKIFSKRHSNS